MSKTKPEMKILNLDIAKSRDDVDFEQIIELGGHKLKLSIRSNAYKFQCHARVHIWQKDKLEWSLVCTIMPELMKTPEGMVYKQNPHLGLFATDADALIAKAKKILF